MTGADDFGTRDEMVTHVCSQLAKEFSGVFTPQTIQRFVHESFDSLSRARVQAFVPLFIYRFAKEHLKAVAQAKGAIVKEVPEVLFVCVHNAGRSQMAATLLERAAQGRVHVRSAGSTPANEIHEGVREVMAEIGVDLSREFPKPLTDEVVQAADVVITMGCGDSCPVYPGKRYLDWDLPDPANKPIDEVRPLREEIDRRVRALLDELVPKRAATAG
ncbi:arsenate reductase ArsC [soil metagenome]